MRRPRRERGCSDSIIRNRQQEKKRIELEQMLEGLAAKSAVGNLAVWEYCGLEGVEDN